MAYLVNWRDDSFSYHPLEEQVTSTSKGSEKEPLALDKPGHCSSALSDLKDLSREVKSPVATLSCISSAPLKLLLPC